MTVTPTLLRRSLFEAPGIPLSRLHRLVTGFTAERKKCTHSLTHPPTEGITSHHTSSVHNQLSPRLSLISHPTVQCSRQQQDLHWQQDFLHNHLHYHINAAHARMACMLYWPRLRVAMVTWQGQQITSHLTPLAPKLS